MENKSKELEVAIKAALEAGKILEKYFETELEHSTKEDNSIVTKVDSECEEIIKNILSKEFPQHSILAEETGHTKNTGSYTWLIDPLDGTRNFTRGIPLFAVSIALEQEGEIIVGVVYNPATRSLYYAEKGKGAYLNNKKISVSKEKTQHFILVGGKGRKDEDRDLFRKLMHYLPEKIEAVTIRDFGCTTIDLVYFARGGIEAAVSLGLKPYDFAAGVLIAQEAGAMITTLDGSPWAFPGNYFIASNGYLHDKLVSEINNIKKQ